MTPSEPFTKAVKPYPHGGTYGELLEWHLTEWGTHPKCRIDVQNDAWKYVHFAHVVHIGLPPTLDPETPEKKLYRWRIGLGLPNPKSSDRVSAALFGDEPALAEWKDDLARTLKREREENAARRGTKLSSNVTQPSLQELIPPYHRQASDLGISRELLEVLALRFGYDAPDDPAPKLAEFIKRAAVEYHELKARISVLLGQDEKLSNLLGTAQAYLDEAKFDLAEEILRLVEEQHQEQNTLKAIRAQAEIRVSRGDTALLAGDAEAGLKHYDVAASFFHPFCHDEEVNRRTDLAMRLLSKGRIYWEDYGHLAVELLRPTLDIYPRGSLEWGIACYHIGYCQCRHWVGRSSDKDAANAARALEYFRDALEVFDPTVNDEIWVSANEHYCFALMILAKNCAENDDAVRSISFYRQAIERCDKTLCGVSPRRFPQAWLEFADLRSSSLMNTSSLCGAEALKDLSECFSMLHHTFENRHIIPDESIWLTLAERYVDCAEGLIGLLPQIEQPEIVSTVDISISELITSVEALVDPGGSSLFSEISLSFRKRIASLKDRARAE